MHEFGLHIAPTERRLRNYNGNWWNKSGKFSNVNSNITMLLYITIFLLVAADSV